MKVVPISKENHQKWSYTGLTSYIHTKKDSIVPIVMAEIGRLISTNPIVFLDKETKGIELYSLQGLIPESNLMINAQGLWVTEYIPARYRALPFVLASDSDRTIGDDKILCYIDDVKCVGKNFKSKSAKIFNEKGGLSEEMQKVFDFLSSIEQNEMLTRKALDTIKKADVLEDWTIELKLADGERKMTGLKKVNMEKLKALSGETLHSLNKSGGLDICFASNLSLHNIQKLRNLVVAQAKNVETKNQSENTENTKSLRDVTLEKQKKAQKEEMDTLVKDLLLDDEI